MGHVGLVGLSILVFQSSDVLQKVTLIIRALPRRYVFSAFGAFARIKSEGSNVDFLRTSLLDLPGRLPESKFCFVRFSEHLGHFDFPGLAFNASTQLRTRHTRRRHTQKTQRRHSTLQSTLHYTFHHFTRFTSSTPLSVTAPLTTPHTNSRLHPCDYSHLRHLTTATRMATLGVVQLWRDSRMLANASRTLANALRTQAQRVVFTSWIPAPQHIKHEPFCGAFEKHTLVATHFFSIPQAFRNKLDVCLLWSRQQSP